VDSALAGVAKKPSPQDVSLAFLLGDTYNKQQPEFILATEFEVCWVGGLGCGKTYAGCVTALRHMLKYGPGARFLIARRTFDEAEATIKKDFFELVRNKNLVHLFDRPQSWDYAEGTNLVRMKNGAELMFHNLQSVDKLKNFQWSGALIDQLEEVPFDVYSMLLQRVRWTGVPGDDRHVWSIANDEGDIWLRRRFLTFDQPHGRPSKDAGRKLIRGVSFDNPHLDKQARAQLLAMPKELQGRYIYAEMAAGNTRLIPDIPVIPAFPVPAHWPRWCGIDPARSTGVTCAEFVTVNPDEFSYHGVRPNAPHFYSEYWVENREAEKHAKELLEMTGPHRIKQWIMDRSSWHSTAKSTKYGNLNLAQFYQNADLPVTPSMGDEWVRVELYSEALKRGLTVSDACTKLNLQAPEYRVMGQTISGKLIIKGKQHFHSVDAGGYALSVIPTKAVAVDLRILQPMFDIAQGVDDASRAHWESQLRVLPLMRGRESVVTMSMDEDEFHRESGDERPTGRLEDERW
jgi:hypothetical protein